MKLEHIYNQAKDKNVAGNRVYGKSDNKVYAEATYVNQIGEAALLDLFYKGNLIVVVDDVEYKPVACGEDDTGLFVMIVTADGTTATTAVLAKYYGKAEA